jgi:tetratricopeptide (TPR) repeat protein
LTNAGVIIPVAQHWIEHMSKERVASLAAALLIGTPAIARCACLDTVDDAKRQMEEQAALLRLPSEASRSLARQFMQQKLFEDAKQYYDQAVRQAAEESIDVDHGTGGLQPASVEHAPLAGRIAHALEVDKEAADFAAMRGDPSGAAALRERALGVAQSLKENLDLGQEYSAIAALFESAGDKSKAAQYYNKLAEHLSATHGRYDRETVAAWANYRRVAAH